MLLGRLRDRALLPEGRTVYAQDSLQVSPDSLPRFSIDAETGLTEGSLGWDQGDTRSRCHPDRRRGGR